MGFSLSIQQGHFIECLTAHNFGLPSQDGFGPKDARNARRNACIVASSEQKQMVPGAKMPKEMAAVAVWNAICFRLTICAFSCMSATIDLSHLLQVD